jgi:hypothetical protein
MFQKAIIEKIRILVKHENLKSCSVKIRGLSNEGRIHKTDNHKTDNYKTDNDLTDNHKTDSSQDRQFIRPTVHKTDSS